MRERNASYKRIIFLERNEVKLEHPVLLAKIQRPSQAAPRSGISLNECIRRFVYGQILTGWYCGHVHPHRTPNVTVRISEVATIHGPMVLNGIYVGGSTVFGGRFVHGIDVFA
jgi:hypothetical protein